MRRKRYIGTGAISKYQDGLNYLCGQQQESINYEETFKAVVKWITNCLIVLWLAAWVWNSIQLDFLLIFM